MKQAEAIGDGGGVSPTSKARGGVVAGRADARPNGWSRVDGVEKKKERALIRVLVPFLSKIGSAPLLLHAPPTLISAPPLCVALPFVPFQPFLPISVLLCTPPFVLCAPPLHTPFFLCTPPFS